MVIVVAVSTSSALLIVLFHLSQDLEFKWYPHYTIPLVTLLPLVYYRFIAARLVAGDARLLSSQEKIILATVAISGSAMAAYYTEAAMLFAAIAPTDETLVFKDMLFASFRERYSVSVIFGASYFTSVTAVVAYVSIVGIPLRTALILRAKSKSSDPD